MKKLVTLLAAAGMVVAASAPASAVDVKVDARHRVSFMTGEKNFTGANQEFVQQRLRLGLTMAASENLSGYVNFEIGKEAWGTTSGTNGNLSVKARQVYLDWTVPATAIKVRMGRHQFGLPGDAFGNNAVFAAGWGNHEGMIVTSPVTDWLGVTALWSRIGVSDSIIGTGDGKDINSLDGNLNDDLFAVAANLKFEGISGSVWGAYAALDGADAFGSKSGKDYMGTNFVVGHGNAWWLGATATVSYFDPFTLKLSAAYGSYEASDKLTDDTAGWNVQAKASYKTSFGTPVLGAFYFSGYDKDNDGLMPSLGGYFTPTRSYHDAAKGLTGLQGKGIPSGNWGVQAGIEKVSFLQGLTHDFLVTYMQGTNDKDAKFIKNTDAAWWYLTEDDSLVEFDLVNTYQIYKNLAAHLEFSYIISDFDTDRAVVKNYTENDWRAELCFEYKF